MLVLLLSKQGASCDVHASVRNILLANSTLLVRDDAERFACMRLINPWQMDKRVKVNNGSCVCYCLSG